MGTKTEATELQDEIKLLIGKLGWSQTRLAEVIYIELNEVDNEDELNRFREKLKKELQRPTTNPDRLREYLRIIAQHPEAQKLDVVANRHVPLNAISTSLSKELKSISGELDKIIKKGGY